MERIQTDLPLPHVLEADGQRPGTRCQFCSDRAPRLEGGVVDSEWLATPCPARRGRVGKITADLLAMTPEERTRHYREWQESITTPQSLVQTRPPQVPLQFTRERATFERYTPRTASQEVAKAAAQEFLARCLAGKKPSMLAFIGNTGTGKSHLLYAIRWGLYAAGARKVTHGAWYRLSDELRYGTKGPDALAPHEVRWRLWDNKVILIDEATKTANTEFDDTEWHKLACHCADNGVFLLVTTQVNPFALLVGEGAADRFHRVVIDAPTGRKTRRET
jgi:chromosomal replication initiation ATPase DnaA